MLQQKGKKITTAWMPGRTGNKRSYLANEMAKAATQDWVTPTSSISLLTSILASLQALDMYGIRNHNPKREQDSDNNNIIIWPFL